LKVVPFGRSCMVSY